jgi:hypothetical protein
MYAANCSSAVWKFSLSCFHPSSIASEQKSRPTISGRHTQEQVKLTGQVGVIDLNIADAGFIQDLELGLISLGDVGKVFIVVIVDSGRVSLVGTVSEMVPVQNGSERGAERCENGLTKKDSPE